MSDLFQTGRTSAPPITGGTPEARHLPPMHALRMGELQAGTKTYDGRSLRWARELGKTDFVEISIIKEKKKTSITASLTDRGRYALERDLRGVDPYLRVTS